MNILFSTYWGIPQAGRLNRYLKLLKKELEQHGHQVDILAHDPDMQQIYIMSDRRKDEFVRQLTGQSVNKSQIKDVIYHEVYGYYQKYLPHVHPWIRWREIERYTFELAVSLFNLNQYDLIHAHDVISARALWRVKPNHVPLVFQHHGLLANDPYIAGNITSKQSVKWRYVAAEEYYGAISSDRTIVPSQWMLQELQQNYEIPTEQCKAIPYGMEIAPFLEWLQYEPYPAVAKSPDTCVITCLAPARLVPERGHKSLIDALSILQQKGKDFVCWLIGDGGYRSELERYCAEKGVADHVVFMGQRTDLPSLLSKSDIIVVPSHEDHQPHTIMEAQVAGKAIIASDGAGIPEMIKHGETGLIFEAGNSVQMADRLLEVTENQGLRQHLETNAKAWGVQMWSSQVLVERMLSVYDQVGKGVNAPNGTSVQQPDADDARDSIERIFIFRAQTKFNKKEWHAIAKSLPSSYSIPDLAFLKVLTETNEFDE